MARPPVRFDSVGRCIYCGAEDKLSDEHIIPRGLKGDLILPKASCPTCATITGRIENSCLRHMMGRFRRRIGIKSPKPQPAALPLPITNHRGDREEILVPIPELPAAIAFPFWTHPPLLLVGETRPFEVEIWTWLKNDTPQVLEKLGATGFDVAEIQPQIFTRMIAKIAHAHAVATYGLGKFRPLLNDHILKGLENPNSLVGGPPTKPDAEKCLHFIRPRTVARDGKSYILSEVRLLAQLGAPCYWVLAGEL